MIRLSNRRLRFLKFLLVAPHSLSELVAHPGTSLFPVSSTRLYRPLLRPLLGIWALVHFYLRVWDGNPCCPTLAQL